MMKMMMITWQDCPGKDSEQYPGNPGQVVSADAPAACNANFIISVMRILFHIVGLIIGQWEALFISWRFHFEWLRWPTRAAAMRIFLEHAMPFEDKLVLKLGLVSSLCTYARKVYSQLASRARPRPSKQQACALIRRSRTLEAGTTGIRALEFGTTSN